MAALETQLPNFIIAGVNKAGTTSLFAYLAQHPQIGASAIKETCYFLPLRYGDAMTPLDEYRSLFAQCADKPVRMESTPGYFSGGEPIAAALDQTLGPELKLVVVLREPVGRLVSFYNFQRGMLKLPADLTLAEYVRQCQALSPDDRRLQKNNPWYGIEGGQYADFWPTWRQRFGDRLKVVFFDDLKADSRAVVRDVLTFLQLDPADADRINMTVENKSTNYRRPGLQRLALAVNHAGERFWRSHPKLKRTLRRAYYAVNGRSFERVDDQATLNQLRQYFEPYNARLAAQLREAGYDNLPAWLSS